MWRKAYKLRVNYVKTTALHLTCHYRERRSALLKGIVSQTLPQNENDKITITLK